jgi:glycerol-3-phosphate acyltransferase PlsY
MTAPLLADICAILVAYLLGSLSTGYFVVRRETGEDLRTLGSGNLGARNAGRVLGARGFLVTLGGDMAKGALAVLLARWLGVSHLVVGIVAVVVVLGHVRPVFLAKGGGKGVATWIGATGTLDPLINFGTGFLFLGLFLLVRRFTIAGLVAVLCAPLVALALGAMGWHIPLVYVPCIALGSVVVVLSHWNRVRWLWDLPVQGLALRGLAPGGLVPGNAAAGGSVSEVLGAGAVGAGAVGAGR